MLFFLLDYATPLHKKSLLIREIVNEPFKSNNIDLSHFYINKKRNIPARMKSQYDPIVSYINHDTLGLLVNLECFKLLSMLPKEYFWLEDNSMHMILFAIKNDTSLDVEHKITLAQYWSGIHHGWNIHLDKFVKEFFQAKDLCKKTYPREVRLKTWSFVRKLCKVHSPEEFNKLHKQIKRLNKSDYQRKSREEVAKKEFLNSALYKFIQSLTEDDHGRVTTKDLFERYQKFCEDNKLTSVTHDKMAKDLNKHNIQAIKYSHNRCFILSQSNIDQFLNYYDTENSE